MINLLSGETKKSIRAAHTNTILIKYIIFIGFSSLFLALACMTSYLILNDNKLTEEKTITNFQTKNSSYSSVTKQTNDFILNLTKAKVILDEQISYSTIITGIANALPSGVILESPLTIANSTIGTPMALKAYAKTSSSETALKSNFQKSSIFSNYNIQPVTNNSVGSSEYPYLISFNITINKAGQ